MALSRIGRAARLLGCLCWALLPLPALATFEEGVAAFQREDYAAAIAAWQPLAAQDNASALFNLGQMYRRGLGVEENEAQAEAYYRRAAVLGHVSAQANLGSLYFTRKPPQPKEAIYFWRQAARQGDAVSQFQLGAQYFNGDVVVQDRVEGYAWMILAADNGLQDARDALATMRRFLSTEQQQDGAALALSIRNDRARAEAGVRSVPLAPTIGPQAQPALPPPPNAEPADADRWRVQIAARRSAEDAQSALDKAVAMHPGLLASAAPFVYRIDLGEKGVFYRAQFGVFAERSEASALCQRISAAGGDCFVTRTPGR